MAKRDYYEILGVARDAEDPTIKKAYRRVAMDNHPDRNPGDPQAEDRFKEAAEAYEVLRDGEKRRLYDAYGHDGLKGSGFQGFHGFEDIFSSFGDVFGDLFGGGMGGRSRDPNAPRRGDDLSTTVVIEFRDAVFGARRELDVTRAVSCGRCKGEGSEPGHSPETCTTCRGSGQAAVSRGPFVISSTCPRCGGRGRQITHPCSECSGGGRVEQEDKIKVEVPAGIEHGMQLRVTGKGGPGHKGGPPGDLYVRIGVREHEHFRREGEDLITELDLPFVQAALGAEVEVPTLEDPVTLKIPPGTQFGQMFRVREQGVPRLRGRGRGDLVVLARLIVPEKLSTRQKELLTELAEEEDLDVNDRRSIMDRIRENLSG